jgi:hypothetical protein
MAMKNTEAMEQAPKSTELALANGEAGGLEMPADQRRRRLVRGAAAFAPVVLTLRSGALAAASCTGAVVVSATFDADGKITSSGVREGDFCVPSPQICSYPDGHQKINGTPDSQAIGNNGKCGTTNLRTNVAIVSSASATSLRGV